MISITITHLEINKAKKELAAEKADPPQERAVDVAPEVESGSELVRFQSQISNWSGPDLSTNSSQLIHSSKATLISLAESGPKQASKRIDSLFMYLFDNQLVLCSNGYFNTLVYYHRFDLAYLSFTLNQSNFIFSAEQEESEGFVTKLGPQSPLPAPPPNRIEVHVKAKLLV